MKVIIGYYWLLLVISGYSGPGRISETNMKAIIGIQIKIRSRIMIRVKKIKSRMNGGNQNVEIKHHKPKCQ